MKNLAAIKKLENEIRRHNRLYFKLAKPEISDYEFDRLVEKLKELKPDSPVLIGIPSDSAPTAKEFKKVFKSAGESTMINLMVAGKKHPVMIHEVITDPRTDEITGIDFYQVRLDEKLKLKVPLQFVGESAGVKEKQGTLIKALSEVEVEALPQDLPHFIEVNIAKLADIGSNIHVKELVVPKGVKVLVDPEFVVATITARMTEEQEAKLAEAADVSTIKSEVEEKKEERAKEKEAVPEAAAAAPTGKATGAVKAADTKK